VSGVPCSGSGSTRSLKRPVLKVSPRRSCSCRRGDELVLMSGCPPIRAKKARCPARSGARERPARHLCRTGWARSTAHVRVRRGAGRRPCGVRSRRRPARAGPARLSSRSVAQRAEPSVSTARLSRAPPHQQAESDRCRHETSRRGYARAFEEDARRVGVVDVLPPEEG
jgi:hypothetical protein